MKKTLIYILFAFYITGPTFAQLNYSCDMEGAGCGPDWGNNGFAYYSSGFGGSCSGYGVYDNNWSGNTKTTTWNSTAINGHTGGSIVVTVKTRLLDYSSPYTDRSASEWGSLQIYYNTSTPSELVPGTPIGSPITSSTDCQTHSVSFSPGTTLTNLYIAIEYNWGSGDNYIWFDDVTVTECLSGVTTYYSKSSGDLDDLSTWGTEIDGTGCPPANFTTAGVTYYVHNNTAPTTSGTWTVSGSGSKVVVGDVDNTVVFTAGAALDFDCDLELAEDGTLNLNDNNMNLEGDLIRSNASAVFNPGPSGTNTVTFDGGTDQYINVTAAGGSTPSNADLTFYDVVVTNGSTVRMYYKFTNSKKLNINDLTVDSGNTLHFISD